MKTYVIIVSEFFPKTHPRAGEKTDFPLAIKHYDKIHTIRANYELWKKRFEKIDKGEAILSIRIWEGKPYTSKQLEIFKYDKTKGIGLEKLTFFTDKDDMPRLSYPLVNHYAEPKIEYIAKNDGLTYTDFKDWFREYDLNEPLAIIHFTDFRYCH